VVGENKAPFDTLPDQVYVLAPDPFNVTLEPKQMIELLTLALTIGNGIIEMI